MSIRQLASIAICLATLLTSPGLYAHHNASYGRVIQATPVYEIQHFRASHNRHRSHHNESHGRAIAGGVIGAAIGHRVGRDKHVGALVGGLIGAHIGHRSSKNKHTDSHAKHHNHRSHRGAYSREVLTGYNVTYRYHGHIYTTFTREHPGKRIPIVAFNTHKRGHRHHRS